MTLPQALAKRFRDDLQALTGPNPGRLGIAVSGGPDSLALLQLAHAVFPNAIQAATVDHGLRDESAGEARFVAGLCAELGIAHAILSADAPIEGNIQAEARALRYRLLADWGEQAGLDWLLTAHHADDQAETLAMRLGRGAGLSGLSGIRAAVEIAGIRVARPLLGWRRAELAAIVADAGLTAIADPSNEDDRFDRARIRKRLAEADWLDPAAVVRSTATLAAADDALDWTAGRLFEARVESGAGSHRFDPSGIPPELRRRILLRLLAASAEPPRGDALQRLLATLEAGGTATLAGVKCEGGTIWRFSPAPPRRS